MHWYIMFYILWCFLLIVACTCNTLGTVGNYGCDKRTGECRCKRYVTGRMCGECHVCMHARNTTFNQFFLYFDGTSWQISLHTLALLIKRWSAIDSFIHDRCQIFYYNPPLAYYYIFFIITFVKICLII